MDTQHPWSDMSTGDGAYARWTEPGQQIVGTILELGVGTDLQGNNCPQLTIRTNDGEQIVTCSQAQLKSKIIALHQTTGINVGDKIAIIFTGSQSRAGGKTLKEFDVSLKTSDQLQQAPTNQKPSAADLI
jgi:hypothetical protein